MPVTVLRLTRHALADTPEQPGPQRLALQRIYGPDVQIVEISETVQDAARVAALISEYHADVLEAVLPLPLVAACLDPRTGVGVPVIRAVMDRELQPSGEPLFTFRGYERILRITIETEPL